ncbi:MAG TPA: hypothetical protein VGK73_31375 [Polyangiaceae bacterium]
MGLVNTDQFSKALEIYGPNHVVAYARWAPTAYSSANNQTLTESEGISSVRQTAAGTFTVTFVARPKAIIPVSVNVIENDTTTYHFARCESTAISSTAGTAVVTHKSVAYASVASGPALSDTVDEMVVIFILRMEN